MQDGNIKIAEWLEQERSEREKQKSDLYNFLDECIKNLDNRMLTFKNKTQETFDSLECDQLKEINS